MDAGSSRARIVAATDACYARLGIDKTTMDEVAREAGLSRPTIYRHFAAREDLVLAVVQARTWTLFDRVRAFISTRASVDSQVVDGVIYLVDQARRDPVLRLLVNPEHLAALGRLEQGSRLSVEFNVKLWRPVLEAGQRAGAVAPGIDIDGFCRWLMFVELIMVSRMDHSPGDERQHRESLHEYVIPALHRSEPGASRP